MSAWYSVFVLFLPLVKSITFGDSLIQTPLVEANENTFLKVIFPGGEEEYVRNWECHEGIWAEDMNLKRQPNCVCVKGVYAIGTNLCDDNFKIIAGDNHCFDIRGQVIRKFIPLTGKRGFDGKANTVFRADAPYFARLNSPTPSTSVLEPLNYLFRMNDPNDFSIYARLGSGQAAKLKCLRGQDVPEDFLTNPVMQIAKLPNCSNEFRGPKSWCDDSSFSLDYQWTFKVGESWTLNKQNAQIGKGDKYPSTCNSAAGNSENSKKAAAPKKGRSKRAAPQKGKKPEKAAAKSTQQSSGSPTSGAAVVQIEEQKCNNFDDKIIEKDEYDWPADHFFQQNPTKPTPKFNPASFHQKEVNKQNRRVGHLLRKFYLDGDGRLNEVPRFTDFDEYKYIQISKEILKAVCAPLHPYVVDFFVRAFRLLYIDSSPGYPYPIKSNKHEHARIEAALNKCKQDAKPVDFIMGNTSCPGYDSVQATNQSVNASMFVYHEMNSNSSMPGDIAFNVSSMDLAVELIWKMTMLTHYYCNEKFERNPIDFSLYFVKVEAMLKNPAIMFRWYYPGQFNRMMQFFLMNHNIEKFAKGVDRCVEAVFAGSKYNEWLTRPAEVVGWMAKSKKLNHEIGKTIRSATSNLGKGRKKRFYLQDDMWQKQAYCMRVTDAAYEEVRTSTFLSCKLKPIWFDNTDG